MNTRIGARTAFRLVIVLACMVAVGAAFWGLACLPRYVSQPRGPRPLFMEWAYHRERGWGWHNIPSLHDRDGTWLYTDFELNMVVAIVTRDPNCPGRSWREPNRAELLLETPFAVSVTGEPNSVIVFAPDLSSVKFSAPPAFARGWCVYPERSPSATILDFMVTHLQCDSLTAFVEPYLSHTAEDR
jgi:hypothetical protein